MARPLTTVWQHKHSALNPLRDAQLGFVAVTHALADQLVAEGSAQHPRIGEFRFERIDRTPLAVVVTPTAKAPAPAPKPAAPIAVEPAPAQDEASITKSTDVIPPEA